LSEIISLIFAISPLFGLSIRGLIDDSVISQANNSRQQKGKTMSNFTTIEVKYLSTANLIAKSYKSLGYTVKINFNAGAFINSSVRTDDMFIIVISKN